jgi:hypothetical protein
MWLGAEQANRFAYAKSFGVIESEANGCFPFVFDLSRLSLACVTSWSAVRVLSFQLWTFDKSGAHHGLHETISRTG